MALAGILADGPTPALKGTRFSYLARERDRSRYVMASKKKKPAPKKKAKPAKAVKKASAKVKRPVKKAVKKPVKKKVVKKLGAKAKAPVRKPVAKPLKKAVKPVVQKHKVVVAKPAAKAPVTPVRPIAKPQLKTTVKPAVPAAKPGPSATVAKAPAASPPVPKPPKPPSKKPEVPKGPMTVVMTGVDPLSGPVRSMKRALKERFIVEYYIHSTPLALYELISTPSGLSKWFCDDVNVRGEEFTFVWGNDEQTAEVLSRKQGELIRMHWTDDDDEGSFFELRIRIDPLTTEVAIIVTDHAWPNELEKARQLWESQLHTLQRVLGA